MTPDERSKTDFAAGDLVFAKMKNYPAWPAKVLDENEMMTMNPPKLPVLFLGTNELGYIRKQDLYDYEEFRERFAAPKKIRGFNEGLVEIDGLFKMSRNSIDDTQSAPTDRKGRGRRRILSANESAFEGESDSDPMYGRLLKRAKEEAPDSIEEDAGVAGSSTAAPFHPGAGTVKAEPPDVVEERSIVYSAPADVKLESSPAPFSMFDKPVVSEKRVRKKKTFSDDFVADEDYPGAKKRRTTVARRTFVSRPEDGRPSTRPAQSLNEVSPVIPDAERLSPTENPPNAEVDAPWCNLVIDEPAQEHDYEMAPILEQPRIAPLKIKFCKKMKDKARSSTKPAFKISCSEPRTDAAEVSSALEGERQRRGEYQDPAEVEGGSEVDVRFERRDFHGGVDTQQKGTSEMELGKRRPRGSFFSDHSPKKKPYIQKKDDETEEQFLIRRRVENRRLKKARKQKKLFVTAYGYWCDLEAERMMKAKPQLNEFQEVRRMLQNKWRMMPTEEKEMYRILAKEERRRRMIRAGKIEPSFSPPPRRHEPSGSGRRGRPARPSSVAWPADADAVLLRREAAGPAEARCRWWSQAAVIPGPGRRGARENSPPRLLGSSVADATAVFKVMARAFQQMASRLQKSEETCAASTSAFVDTLMDGFFITLTHLLTLTKHASPLNECFPKDILENLMEKTAYLTPL